MKSARTVPRAFDREHRSPAVWQIDPSQSSAAFRAASLWGLVLVRGRLGEVTGALEWRDTGRQGRMAIAVAGLSSGIRLRDHHLRGRAFFDVSRHPEIAFDVTEVVAAGDVLQLHGELDVRGRRHPFAATAGVRRAGGERIELQAGARLDLDELGMSRGLLGMIPAAVTADVRVVLRRVAA